MIVEVIKDIIIRASLKKVGEIIDLNEKDVNKYRGFIKEVEDESDKELANIQEGHGEVKSEPSKKSKVHNGK